MARSREELLNIRTKATAVEVPGYGEFHLRVLTLAETGAWQKQNAARTDDDNYKVFPSMLVYALSDEDGKRLFRDGEIDLLSEKLEFPLVEILFDHAMKISKLRKEDKSPEATAKQAKN